MKKRLISAFIVAMIFYVGSIPYEYIVHKHFTEVSDIFVYTAIKPLNDPQPIGEDLVMISENRWFRSGNDVEWHDILRCEDVTFFSEYKSGLTDYNPKPPLGRLASSTWNYNSFTPSYETDCYIDSTISACFDIGGCHSQNIRSEVIQFRDLQDNQ